MSAASRPNLATIVPAELDRLVQELVDQADFYAESASRHGGAQSLLDAGNMYLAAEAIRRRANVLRDIESAHGPAADRLRAQMRFSHLEGAARIVDIWMGGDQSWRSRLEDSEFLESADWQTAVRFAEAVLSAHNEQGRT